MDSHGSKMPEKIGVSIDGLKTAKDRSANKAEGRVKNPDTPVSSSDAAVVSSRSAQRQSRISTLRQANEALNGSKETGAALLNSLPARADAIPNIASAEQTANQVARDINEAGMKALDSFSPTPETPKVLED